MANKFIVIALLLVAVVGMTSAAPSIAPAADVSDDADYAEGPAGADYAEGPAGADFGLMGGESNDSTIGTITGGITASDAASVGAPVANGVFKDVAPVAGAPAPDASSATAIEVTAVVAAGVIGSLFL